MIAVSILGPAMNQREHFQIFLAHFPGGINEHAFDTCAVVRGPMEGLALRHCAVGEYSIKCCYRPRVCHFVQAISHVDFSWLLQRRIYECNASRLLGN